MVRTEVSNGVEENQSRGVMTVRSTTGIRTKQKRFKRANDDIINWMPHSGSFSRQIHKRRMKKEVGRVLRCDRRSQRARCKSCKSKCPLYFLQRCRTAGAAARGGAFWLLARSERGGRALKSVNDRGSKWKSALNASARERFMRSFTLTLSP